MIFIIMVNGNGRPPACKMQEARTGNYIPIWSGLIANGITEKINMEYTSLLTKKQYIMRDWMMRTLSLLNSYKCNG